MTDLPREFVDQIARAIGDPGSVVGRKFGPSWGEGNDGYAENEETVTRWSTRAVLEVLVASGYRREADVRAAIAYEIRAELVCCDIYERLTPKRAEISAGKPGWGEAYSELVDAIDDHDLCYWGDAAARIAESHELRTLGQATALEQAQPLPVAGSFGAVVHEQTGLKGTSKAGQERSEEQRHG